MENQSFIQKHATILAILATLLVLFTFSGGGNPIRGMERTFFSENSNTYQYRLRDTKSELGNAKREISSLGRQLKKANELKEDYHTYWSNELRRSAGLVKDTTAIGEEIRAYQDSLATTRYNLALIATMLPNAPDSLKLPGHDKNVVRVGKIEIETTPDQYVRVFDRVRDGNTQTEITTGSVEAISQGHPDGKVVVKN